MKRGGLEVSAGVRSRACKYGGVAYRSARRSDREIEVKRGGLEVRAEVKSRA